LAALGYIVVSINANRGVNAAPGVPGDRGLNVRRSRLVLRHLQQLRRWSPGAETPPSGLGDLAGRIDFSHVGLLGHSCGGEGMRAAYNLYQSDPGGTNWQSLIGPVSFEAIFEIGPVDGQTAFMFNALGTAWNVLLPMCDGDVFNLQGVRPFDRMLRAALESPQRQKSAFTVWGANHNFYNTGTTQTNDVNQVKSMRSVQSATLGDIVEIELTSNREFLPQGEMLVLRIGSQDFTLGRYPNTGETTTNIFTLSSEEFARISQGDPVNVQYGHGPTFRGWSFGKADKTMLGR
ncbi:MAG: hypothetical protein L0219_22200, partial [Phycisphaerales bacterium]|nr:hypothetical protein [Phycisphaerales bacterium]